MRFLPSLALSCFHHERGRAHLTRDVVIPASLSLSLFFLLLLLFPYATTRFRPRPRPPSRPARHKLFSATRSPKTHVVSNDPVPETLGLLFFVCFACRLSQFAQQKKPARRHKTFSPFFVTHLFCFTPGSLSSLFKPCLGPCSSTTHPACCPTCLLLSTQF